MIDSAVMAGFGIVQRGESTLLHRPARPVVLPGERPILAEVVDRLRTVAAMARSYHPFAGGMGLAAPQIGISQAVAIVQRPGTDDFVVLVNPLVMGGWEVTVEFEGCLSFFDVRGIVPRPNLLAVSYQLPDGRRQAEMFRGSLARLVAHEIDHLNGRLYTDLMEPDAPLLPVAEYRVRRCVELSG